MNLKHTLVLLGIAISFSVRAESQRAHIWEVSEVIDGDTFTVQESFYPPELGHIKVRIKGVNTPEQKSKALCAKEIQMAEKAKVFLKSQLTPGSLVTVTSVKQDFFPGRVVGYVTYVDAKGLIKDLSSTLLSSGHAVVYHPTKKHQWCK